ncbi:MAG: HAD-IC family P-type ATPase [Candidatus Micrarchaeia archaeon]
MASSKRTAKTKTKPAQAPTQEPPEGLSSAEAEKRLAQFGRNEIMEKKPSVLLRLFKGFTTPISLMLFLAAILSYFGDEIFDFYFILFLLLINVLIDFWQERKADDAIEKLNEKLKVKSRALRDGKWDWIDSSELVPGDVIELVSGDIIPADVKFVEAKNLSVNEAALTGESLPQDKKEGESTYSGAFVANGQGLALVSATGRNTYFGKTLLSVEKRTKPSILEQDILGITKFLSIVSFLGILLLTAVFLARGQPLIKVIVLDLSLAIAGIPVALPTVMSLIISLGVLQLAKKEVIVRRLSSLEDLANVDLLFTDKTGTMTQNKIIVEKIVPYGCKQEDVVHFASAASLKDTRSTINQAVYTKSYDMGLDAKEWNVVDFVPADSDTKMSYTVGVLSGKKYSIGVGAAQVIEKLCNISKPQKAAFARDIASAAADGYRVLAVSAATGVKKDGMELKGLLLLSDPVRPDAKETITFLKASGIGVRMLTGDHRAIGERIGAVLGLAKGEVYSQVLPADKLRYVDDAKAGHTVAVTGDGVNDLPAVKSANVGIAVSNAVDALKSAADIVLLYSGISVISDALIESRKIFARLYSYSVYRISESFRLIVTIIILGLLKAAFPLTPIQIILLALLNDVPIISLAFNRVRIANSPAKINSKHRLIQSTLFGLAGILNSLTLYFVMVYWMHLDWDTIATMFFLKLTISGHLLIYVAHTAERWYKYLPSWPVIGATVATQIVATCLAVFGIFMTSIPLEYAAFVWAWAFAWMQLAEFMKDVQKSIVARTG